MNDATSAVANVDDYSGSAQLLAATTLRWVLFHFAEYIIVITIVIVIIITITTTITITTRNVLGTRNLGDILSEREAIASEMQQGLDSATAPWGVLVERVEVELFMLIVFWDSCPEGGGW